MRLFNLVRALFAVGASGSFNFNPIPDSSVPTALKERKYVLGQHSNSMFAAVGQFPEHEIGDYFAISVCLDHGFHDSPNELPGLSLFIAEYILLGPKKGHHEKPSGFAGDLQSYLARMFNASITIHTTADRTVFTVTGPLESKREKSDMPVGQDRVVAVATVLNQMLFVDGPNFKGNELYAQAAAKNAAASSQARSASSFGLGANGHRVMDMLRVLARHSVQVPKSPWFNTPWPAMNEIEPKNGGWRNLLAQSEQFWKNHYSCQRAAFAVFSKYDVNSWDSLLYPIFGELQQRGGQARPLGGPSPFIPASDPSKANGVEGIMQYVHLQSINNDPLLVFHFPMGPTLDFYQEGSLIYLEYLLSFKGKGGIVDKLRSQNLAHEVHMSKDQNRVGSSVMIWIHLAPEGIKNVKKVTEEIFGYLNFIHEKDGETEDGVRSQEWDVPLRQALSKLTAYRADIATANIGVDLTAEIVKFVELCLTHNSDTILTVGKMVDSISGKTFKTIHDSLKSSNANVFFLDPNYESGQLNEHPSNVEHAFPYIPSKLSDLVATNVDWDGHTLPPHDLDPPTTIERVSMQSTDIPKRSFHPNKNHILELTWRGQPKLKPNPGVINHTPPHQRAPTEVYETCHDEEATAKATPPRIASELGLRANGGRDVHVRYVVRIKSPQELAGPRLIAPTKALFALLLDQLADKYCAATTIVGLPIHAVSVPEGIQVDLEGPPGDSAKRLHASIDCLADSMAELLQMAKDKNVFERIKHHLMCDYFEMQRTAQSIPTAMSLMRTLISPNDETPEDAEILLQNLLLVEQPHLEAYVTAYLRGPKAIEMLIVGNMDHSTALEFADHFAWKFKLEDTNLLTEVMPVFAVYQFDCEARLRSSIPTRAVVYQQVLTPPDITIKQQDGKTFFPSSNIKSVREPNAKEAAAMIVLRMLVQHVVHHLALTEPIGAAGGNVLNREGGGPWSVVFYASAPGSLDHASKTFRNVLKMVAGKCDDKVLFTNAKRLALQSLSNYPTNLLEAVDRDWHEVASSRHYYTRRKEYGEALTQIDPAFVQQLIQSSYKNPVTLLKVFPKHENTQPYVVESHEIHALKSQLSRQNNVVIIQSPLQPHVAVVGGYIPYVNDIKTIVTPPRGYGLDQGFTTFNICLIFFLIALLGVIAMWGFVNYFGKNRSRARNSLTLRRGWRDDEIDGDGYQMKNPVQYSHSEEEYEQHQPLFAQHGRL